MDSNIPHLKSAIKVRKHHYFVFPIFVFVLINIFLVKELFPKNTVIKTNNTTSVKTVVYTKIDNSKLPASINPPSQIIINPTPTRPVVPTTGVIPTPTAPTPAPTPTPAPPTPAPSGGGSSSYTPTNYYSSSNWAGYMVQDKTSSINTVSGSWKVPSVTGTVSPSCNPNLTNCYSVDAAWIGIGGVNSNSLIQTGTIDSIDQNGNKYYFAFYELLPDYATQIPALSVGPGDTISASIKQLSLGSWTISISDLTTGQNYFTSVSYGASDSTLNSSAEWIEEDPMQADGTLFPFNKFSAVYFTNCNATMAGTKSNLSVLKPDGIILTDSVTRTRKTTLSAVTNQTNFNVGYAL